MPGAFELREVLRDGGMGRVWRAVHRRSGLAVAIKSMRSATLDASVFAAEVRAIAALDHPRVVRVFDHGVAGPDEDLDEGRPWLAMVLARGTLHDLLGAPWPLVRQALLHVLDGLAHVHAHGVVHRDLKPQNVLLGCALDALREPDHPIDGLCIADFGLASHDGAEGARGGTPGFMAPEQRHAGRVGPWSDLYAVGAMTALYVNAAFAEVPVELQEWCEWLSADDPRRRPASAAEAMQALHGLELLAPAEPLTTSSVLTASTQLVAEPPVTVSWVDEAPAGRDPTPRSGSPTVATRPVPEDGWELRYSPWPMLSVIDAGLGLLGLRSPPFVGRRDERRALWAWLTVVSQERRPQLVVLEGEPGVGRRRLARWLATRAHELGTHETLVGTTDDVLRQWREQVRCRRPRIAGLADALEDAVDQRPTLLVLEEATPDVLREVERALDDVGGPWLAVVPWTASPPCPRLDHDAVAFVPVGPLAFSDVERLVADTVYLDHDAARTIATAAAGNPGVALGILREWVASGQLEPGPAGFLPPPDARVGPGEDALTELEVAAAAHLDDNDVPSAIDALVGAARQAEREGRADVEHRIGRRIREVLATSRFPSSSRRYVEAMSLAVSNKMEGGRERQLEAIRALRRTADAHDWIDLQCRLGVAEAAIVDLLNQSSERSALLLREAWAIARQHDLVAESVVAGLQLGTSLMRRRLLDEARQTLGEALDLTPALDPADGGPLAGHVHAQLAGLFAVVGDEEALARHARAALAIAEHLAPRHASTVFHALSTAYTITADDEQAVRMARATIRTAREAHFRNREASGWAGLGRTLMHVGRFSEAEEALVQSIAIASRLDSPASQARMNLAHLWLVSGRHRDAWNLLDPEHLKVRRPFPGSQQQLELLRLAARYGRGTDPQQVCIDLIDVLAITEKRLPRTEEVLENLTALARERGDEALARLAAGDAET